MKHLPVLSFFVVSLVISSCTSSLNTFSDYNKNVDFQKYKSFAWVAPDDEASLENQVVQTSYGKLIMSYSNENLAKKGMVPDKENPDALFKYTMGVEHGTEIKQGPTVSVGVAVGAPYYYGGVAVPISGGQISEQRVDEALLIIQMFDAKTGSLVWTGGARKTVDNAADSQKNLKLALNSIFSNLKIKHKVK